MAQGIAGQIIGEIGEIGKQVGGEVAQVPKDIAGKAIESLGVTKSGKTQGQKTVSVSTPQGGAEPNAWEKIGAEKDERIRGLIARDALKWVASGGEQSKKEPSIWERFQREDEQKKQEKNAQNAAAAANHLPTSTSKRPRGDLYGAKAKKTAVENRNVRQD